MKFTIVIPVFNTEHFLSRCLDSIKAQTNRDFEIIVVDDCSPGPCAETIRPYSDCVRYIRHDRNRSAFQARCTGVNAAKGDFIVPVDPDDYLLPETLAKLCMVVERDDSDVVSYWIDCDDGRRVWPHWCRHPAGVESATEMLRGLAAHKANYSIVSKAVRREVYQTALSKLGLGHDAYVNTSEDFLATLAVLLCCSQVSHLDYAGYRYFSNLNSITGGRRSVEGFRRGCAQTRFVHDAIRSMACRMTHTTEVLSRVDDIISLAERWFCAEVMEGPSDHLQEFCDVLLENFHSESVCRAFVEEYVRLKHSRAYRFGSAMSRVLRMSPFRRIGG